MVSKAWSSGWRGINNNNLFNIKSLANDTWKGQVGTDRLGHAIFADKAYSIRALCRDLFNKEQTPPKRPTLLAICTAFAPKKDGNDPVAYADFLANFVGVSPTVNLYLFDADGTIKSYTRLTDLIRGMAQMEIFNGYAIDPTDLSNGIRMYEVDFT